MVKRIVLSLVIICSIHFSDHSPTHAQWFATCQDSSLSDLAESISAHSEHTFRLNDKFLNTYYKQGLLPSNFRPASLKQVKNFLNKLAPRKAAVLFHAHKNNNMCTWLITPGDKVVSHFTSIKNDAFESMKKRLLNSLGIVSMEESNTPHSIKRQKPSEIRRGVKSFYSRKAASGNAKQIIAEISHLLIPPPIVDALLNDKIETLVVVPIAPIGTLPLSTLRMGPHSLVDRLSVVIAPGFSAFRAEPRLARTSFPSSIVIGDPTPIDGQNKEFSALPYARAEAQEVAHLLSTNPLIGEEATITNINIHLQAKPNPDLIYLATHGVANRTNPRDASFLLLGNGRWFAKDIQNIRLGNRHPLVVLSACQTGLGKDFDVGTIGVGRAWLRAGASQIVMSLWNVEDQATRHLMTQFLQFIGTHPTDKALQLAMQQMRKKNSNPVAWSGFTIFGLPEKMRE